MAHNACCVGYALLLFRYLNPQGAGINLWSAWCLRRGLAIVQHFHTALGTKVIIDVGIYVRKYGYPRSTHSLLESFNSRLRSWTQTP